jgi:hypothetical protein
MKPFKSIREGNSVEPGVSEINDVPEDPMSFVEIKPKKTKVVKEELQEAVSVKKEKHSWGTMMTVHHGSDTSYPLHPEHQSAIKKLRPGMKTTFKDETNSTVHAHREGDTVHLTRPKTGSTLTSLPYHHFDTSEHAKPAAKKPAGEYDRKVTDHLKKKYNEEIVVETKGAPKGFHFTKDGKLKRGDASQDGSGGAMLRSDPLDKQRNKIPAVSESVEQMDELNKSTLASYAKKAKGEMGLSAMAAGAQGARGNVAGKVVDMAHAKKRSKGLDKAITRLASESIDFNKLWNSLKPVYEEVKTTHEDPLVTTRDSEGHIHTHANLSVANAIHGTDVKHQAIHSGKPVQAGKFTFELSKHHETALKEDAPFDPEAHKKELDRLMTKHMNAHAETTRLIKAKASQEEINKAQERNNAVKAEIRTHKDKVPAGPAPKTGSAAHYYASKKPGEYTGD